MAFEEDVLDISALVAADLSAYQYHFVKMSADNTITPVTAVTDVIIGVLQNKPTASGQVARVRVYGVTRVMAGNTLTAGDLIGSHTDGHALPKTVNKNRYAGICVEGAAASTNTGTVMLFGPSTISV